MLEPGVEYEVHVDGELVDMDMFTFKEQDEYRSLVRESAGDPTLRLLMAENIDRWPAMVTVVKRRTNPDFSLADAKSLTAADILRPEGSGARPTRGRPKAATK